VFSKRLSRDGIRWNRRLKSTNSVGVDVGFRDSVSRDRIKWTRRLKSTNAVVVEDMGGFRDSLRRWVSERIVPNLEQWEREGQLPRDLYRDAAEMGVLAPGFPVEFGGLGNDKSDMNPMLIVVEELCRAGSGGLIASLLTHNISIPPIVELGRPELVRRVVPQVLRGEKVCALGITEPQGGSDVASLRTTAKLDNSGEHYVLNGEKTLITSVCCFVVVVVVCVFLLLFHSRMHPTHPPPPHTQGMQADFYTIAARTGPDGHRGISVFVVDRDAVGFSRTKLDKMGWNCSDTATLHFDDCIVPKENMLGQENRGFEAVMKNFNSERIFMAAQAVYFSQNLLEHTIDWAKHRETFGKRLIEHQAVRHKIVDMASETSCCGAFLRDVVERFRVGDDCVSEISMLKNKATDCMHFCADNAVQIMGGGGFIKGHVVERLYRETKVMQIGGGSTEIMKDLAAKQMGLMDFTSS